MSCYWCVADTYNLDSGWWTTTQQVEAKLGRKFAGIRMNGGYTRSADWPQLDKDVAYGRTWTYVNGKPNGTVTGYWKNVAAGKMDTAINAFIHKVMSDASWSSSRPFHYSFHHEQYVKAEGGGTAAGTAADYAAAWNHVAALIDKAGAHVSQGGKILRCWVPHWMQVSRDPAYAVSNAKASSSVAPLLASKILSGGLDVSKVDLVGADIYCPTTAGFTADDQWTPLHKLALKVGKPFITGETGIAGSDSKVVGYLKRLDTLLKGYGAGSGPGEVHALCWTNRIAAGGDYRMDASTAKLAQYKAMAQDPFYGATAA